MQVRAPSLRAGACLAGLAAALTLCLTACGESTMTALDATAYVRGVLDETYKGTWDNAFLDLVDLTDGEAQDAYEEALEQEYQRFVYQFDLDDASLTEETRQAAMDLLSQICARAQYTVQSAAALDDTRYAVEVSVRPIDLFLQVEEDLLPAYQEEFAARYEGADLSSSEALASYENAWAQGIIQLCTDRLGLLGHQDVVSMLVLVAPDDDGCYSMSSTDFANLSALILPY